MGSKAFARNLTSDGYGFEFWFESAANADAFENDPWKYAPKWGGFCSWGMAREVAPDVGKLSENIR